MTEAICPQCGIYLDHIPLKACATHSAYEAVLSTTAEAEEDFHERLEWEYCRLTLERTGDD